MINRILLNYIMFLVFCLMFPSFRQLSSFIGFTLGMIIAEYIGYKLTNDK